MKTIIFLLFIVLSSQISAQPHNVWEVETTYYNRFSTIYALFKIDSNVVVIAAGKGDYYPFSPCFIKIDQKGKILIYKSYLNTLYQVIITSVFQTSENTIKLLGYDGRGKSILTTISLNGDILETKVLNDLYSQLFENGDLIKSTFEDSNLTLTLVNNQQDTLWSKQCFRGLGQTYVRYLLRTSNEELIIAGFVNFSVYSKGFVAKLSPMGDSLWFKIVEGKASQINYLNYHNEEILVTGSVNPYNLQSETRILLQRVDLNGNITKKLIMGSGFYNTGAHISVLNDSSYLLAGEITHDGYSKAYLANINQDFTVNWQYIDNKVNNIDYGSPKISDRGKLGQKAFQLDSNNYILAGDYHAKNWGGIDFSSGFISKLSFDVTSVDVVNKEYFKYSLDQNYPNPFNPTTTIKFKIPEEGFVSLTVYDMLGKEVASLVSEEKTAGEYVAEFNASNLSSGVYLYRLQAGSFTETKKLMLMK